MEMTLLPDRLIKIREARGLNKAEASRLARPFEDGISSLRNGSPDSVLSDPCFHCAETQDFPGIPCRSYGRPFSPGAIDLQGF